MSQDNGFINMDQLLRDREDASERRFREAYMNRWCGDYVKASELAAKTANCKSIADLLQRFTYKKGWGFSVESRGERHCLVVKVPTVDSRNQNAHTAEVVYEGRRPRDSVYDYYDRFEDLTGRRRYISTYDEEFYVVHTIQMYGFPFRDAVEAERWLLRQIIKIETHEACEFFKIDGEAPYFPNHELGGDPYAVTRRK